MLRLINEPPSLFKAFKQTPGINPSKVLYEKKGQRSCWFFYTFYILSYKDRSMKSYLSFIGVIGDEILM